MRTRVGYCGGTTESPTYRTIGDHAEALQIDYDPEVTDYESLLGHFWSGHDATREPWGTQYVAAVFAADDDQLALATRTGQAAADARSGPLRTRVERLDTFFRAEDYHQKYRLRREGFTEQLLARYPSDRAFVDSTLAARLNGFVGGHRPRRDFVRLLPQLGLDPDLEPKVLARIP